MAAPNYRQQKRQKELARQSRKAEKQSRKAKQDTAPAEATADDTAQPAAASLPNT